MNRCIHGQEGGCGRCTLFLETLTARTTLWKAHDDTEARDAHLAEKMEAHQRVIERQRARTARRNTK